MPVLHSYVDKQGFYIRSHVNGNPITFQVSPKGASVLRDLGYRSESDIPWSVLRPLYDQGDIYTQNTGIDKSKIEEKNPDKFSQLNQTQRERLQSYLNEETPSVSTHDLKKGLQEILGLSMSVLAERELETLTVSPALEHSLANFKDTLYQAEDVETPSAYEVTYTFDIEGTAFQCLDARWQDDFKIIGDSGEGERQIGTV